MKYALLILFATMSIGLADTPRGYESTDKFEEVKAEAIEKKKLLAILVKGSNDSCPNCATTMDNGNRAVKTSCELLFTRVQDVWDLKTGLPTEITDHFKDVSGGASVNFFVFNPTTLELVAKGNRGTLQSDKKAIREFKKTIREAKKTLAK